MEKIYRTGLVINKNGTGFSFTVPKALVVKTKTRKRTPFQYVDDDGLKLIRFPGTMEEAKARKDLFGDVVLLQCMKREHTHPQYKLNLPKWIYEQTGFTPGDTVKMAWERTHDNAIEGVVEVVKARDETEDGPLPVQAASVACP